MIERKPLEFISSVTIMQHTDEEATIYCRRGNLSRTAHSIRRPEDREVVDDDGYVLVGGERREFSWKENRARAGSVHGFGGYIYQLAVAYV